MFDVFEDVDDVPHAQESRLLQNEHQRMYNNGYRTSKVMHEEALVQEGFDHGYEKGILIGRLVGALYARFKTRMNAAIPPQNSEAPPNPSKQYKKLALRLEKAFMIDIPARLQDESHELGQELVDELTSIARLLPCSQGTGNENIVSAVQSLQDKISAIYSEEAL